MVPLIIFVVPFLVISAIRKLLKSMRTPCSVKDKVVLITGASSGLGEACAKKFAAAGAKLVLCARNVMELNRVKNEICSDPAAIWPLVYHLDVSKTDDVKSCVQGLKNDFGSVDILINNAGVSQRGFVTDTSIEVHRSLMNVNYFGAVQMTNELLPDMIERKSGHIVTVSTVQGRVAIPSRCAYAASKHAVQAFCDSLRAEVAKDNIHVTVVNPGYIRTNLSRNALSGDGSKHGVLDPTTASGMCPSFVAEQILDCVMYPQNELTLADLKTQVAIYLRTVWPSLYFKLMEWRAASDRRKASKSK